MNDDEWKQWAATYAQEQRPMPPVLARAKTDRRRAIVGMAIGYALAAALVLSEARSLLRPRTWPAVTSSVFTLIVLLSVIVGTHVAMWGTFGHGASAPLELLAELERRHAGRRRLLRFMPWITGFAAVAAVATTGAQMIAARRFDPASAVGTLAAWGATVGLVWLSVRRTGRLIDRELREAAEARRLLSEGDNDAA